jgi:tRNA (adenine22-N1)-methyltransferase
LLPVFLVEKGICPFVIAGELNEGPFLAARRNVAQHGLSGRIDVRRGDGLAVLAGESVDVVTIAGMGGNLMCTILSAGTAAGHLSGVKRLVLQPNVGEYAVRRWLAAHGWRLCAEQIMAEDGRIYEILTADRAVTDYVREPVPIMVQGRPLATEWVERLGPFLLTSCSPLLITKWRAEAEKMRRVVRQMGSGRDPATSAKQQQLQAEIETLEEILRCLENGPTANSSSN